MTPPGKKEEQGAADALGVGRGGSEGPGGIGVWMAGGSWAHGPRALESELETEIWNH